MTPSEYQLIKECLGIQKKPYFYFKDKYALDIAKILCDRYHEVRIGDLKRSRFAFVLNKEPVKQIVSGIGRGTIRSDDLEYSLMQEGKEFWYTLSEWGEFKRHRNDSYYQTSRPGVNLVLQLNFDNAHNRLYNQLVKPEKSDHPFAFTSHPVSVRRVYTMCWARLDISLETGEVLVEEIQNDWLREVKRIIDSLAYWEKQGQDVSGHWLVSRTTLAALRKYYSELLKPYYKLWEEAILNLVLSFSKEELGINNIYYHTYESGEYLKGYYRYSLPPRSIYTQLPKRFGFSKTDKAPELIKKDNYLRKKLRRKSLSWFQLML
ncbi:MAG: hypothetical protein ED557_06155 [Balneola sp.]|nr:MAG: hypothetical protein ED557_06155 [Balneola sp.]